MCVVEDAPVVVVAVVAPGEERPVHSCAVEAFTEDSRGEDSGGNRTTAAKTTPGTAAKATKATTVEVEADFVVADAVVVAAGAAESAVVVVAGEAWVAAVVVAVVMATGNIVAVAGTTTATIRTRKLNVAGGSNEILAALERCLCLLLFRWRELQFHCELLLRTPFS